MEITLADFNHCLETWEEMEKDGEEYGEEIVMTSFGYANVTEDGDVVAYGGVLFNVAEDDPDEVVGYIIVR